MMSLIKLMTFVLKAKRTHKHQTKVNLKKQPWFTKECKNAIDSVIENIDDYTKSTVKAYSKKSCKEIQEAQVGLYRLPEHHVVPGVHR